MSEICFDSRSLNPWAAIPHVYIEHIFSLYMNQPVIPVLLSRWPSHHVVTAYQRLVKH